MLSDPSSMSPADIPLKLARRIPAPPTGGRSSSFHGVRSDAMHPGWRCWREPRLSQVRAHCHRTTS
jgi:hypothetical protein